MDGFVRDDAADELAFRKQLPYFLPADEPLRSVGPLLTVISGYAVPAPCRILDMTEPDWKDFHVLPSTASDKDVCLNFVRNGGYKSDRIQFEYRMPMVSNGSTTVDPTRPFWYDCRGPQKQVYATNVVTGIGHRLSAVGLLPDARVSLCCTAPDVVYAAYNEVGVPTIQRIERNGTTSSSYPDQKKLHIGDIVCIKTDTKTGDGDPTFFVQSRYGPHRVTPDWLVPLVNKDLPAFDDGEPKPSWSPFMLMLANGMLLAQAYVGYGSAVVVVDPAVFGRMQRIAKLDTTYRSVALSRSNRNLLYIGCNEPHPDRLEPVESTVYDTVGCFPMRLSNLVAEYQDTVGPKPCLLAMRLHSDFWI